MKIRSRTTLLLAAVFAMTAVGTAKAQGCFAPAGENRTISLSASGVTSNVSIWSYADPNQLERDTPTCTVNTTVQLSSYPSSSLALRPRDVAEAIRDAADELGATECRILVWYVNDTEEAFTEAELCKAESFRFDEDSFWSSAREENCWDPARTAG